MESKGIVPPRAAGNLKSKIYNLKLHHSISNPNKAFNSLTAGLISTK